MGKYLMFFLYFVCKWQQACLIYLYMITHSSSLTHSFIIFDNSASIKAFTFCAFLKVTAWLWSVFLDIIPKSNYPERLCKTTVPISRLII